MLTLCPYTKAQSDSTSPRLTGSCRGMTENGALTEALEEIGEKKQISVHRLPISSWHCCEDGSGARREGFRPRPRWVHFQAVSPCMISMTSVHEYSGSRACVPGSSLHNEAANVLHKATGKRNGGH